MSEIITPQSTDVHPFLFTTCFVVAVIKNLKRENVLDELYINNIVQVYEIEDKNHKLFDVFTDPEIDTLFFSVAYRKNQFQA